MPRRGRGVHEGAEGYNRLEGVQPRQTSNMTLIYNKRKLKEKRKKLRQESTIPERMLWLKLKNKQLGIRFRRQYSIGNYIADFCSPRLKLVVEIEGGVHDKQEQRFYDDERQKTIEELGFRVLRFTNEEVEKDIKRVVETINKHLS
jgi:very-short-patch-repair endonuclease